jgi:hypothetical protein
MGVQTTEKKREKKNKRISEPEPQGIQRERNHKQKFQSGLVQKSEGVVYAPGLTIRVLNDNLLHYD